MGIFDDAELPPDFAQERPVSVWVDTHLSNRNAILAWLIAEGATISADMDPSSTNHLILSPASQGIFDSFCHPDWIPLKLARVREARKETWDVWRGKVLLKSKWVGLCQREGRYLGEADSWANCRVGGPRIVHRSSIPPLRTNIFVPPLDPQDLLSHIYPPISPPISASSTATSGTDLPALGDHDMHRDPRGLQDRATATHAHRATEQGLDEEADMELDMELDIDEDASDATGDAIKIANREVVGHQDAEADMEVDIDVDMALGTAPGTQSQITMTESHPPVPAIPAGLSLSEPPRSSVRAATPTAHHSNTTSDLASSTCMIDRSASPLRKLWTPYETPELIEDTSARSSGPPVQAGRPAQSLQRSSSVQPRIPSDTGVGPSVTQWDERITGAAPDSVPEGSHGGAEAGHSRSATTEITLSASGRDPHVHQVDAEEEETAWNEGKLAPVAHSLPVTSSSESIAKGVGSGQAACAADAGKVMDKEGRTEPADGKTTENQRFGVPATMSDRRGLVSRIERVTPTKYPPRPTPSLPVRPSAAAVTTTEQALVSGSMPVLPVSGASALIPPPTAPKGTDKHSAMLAAQQESIRLGRQKSTVFRGCNVMLQKGKYGRNTYIKLIRQGSGMATDKFMTHNPKTTHVLCDETEFSIIPFPNIQWNVFKQAGVAIVNYNWLMDSARSGRLMPTENYPPKRRQDMPSVSKYATTASVSTAKAVGWGTTAVQRGEADAMTASSSTSTQAHSAAEAVDLSTPREMQDPTVQARSKAPPTGNKSRSSMPASSSTSQAAGKRAPRDALPTWRLVEIFKAVPKGTQPDMKALQAQCGHYKISHWTSLWYQYRNRYERFRNMTPSDTGEDDAHVYGDENHEDHEDDRDEDDDVDADDSEGSDYGAEGGSMRNSPRPAIGTRLVKKRNPMPLAQLVDIFSSVPEGERPDYDELAEKYPYYPRSTWSALWSKFKHRTHRFSNVPIDPSKGLYAFPRNLPGVAADEDSDDDALDEHDEDGGREIALRKTSKAARNALSTEELVEIFRPLPTHIAPNYKKLNQQYPCYSISTWSALWSNWKSRKQRFADIPLDIGPRSALANGQNDGAISDHRQGGSDGHTTGEAADAGEDLSAAELEAVFGNEALQNVSFADRMAIYQAQMPEQPFFVVKGLYADYQSGRGIFQGRAQPPDASVPSTFTDVGDATHHTPAPRTAAPGKQFIPRMLEIFNERYPEDVRLGRTVHAAAAAMTAAHGVYTQGSWANFYSEWKHGSGKFTGYGERSPAGSRAERASEAAPPRSAKGKLPLMSTARTLEIFSARYEDDAKSGASYRDIGLDLWDTHRAYGANTWATFYGEWMQGKGRYEGFGPRANNVPAHLAHEHPSAASTTAKSSAEGPPGHQQQSTTSGAALDPARPPISAQSTDRFGGPPTKASLLRAKLFKGMEDAIRRNPREAANKLGRDEKYAAYGGYDASTWIRMMTSWTNGSAQFKNLPNQLQYGYREVLESLSSADHADVPNSLLQATSSGASLSPEKRAHDDASIAAPLRPSPSPAASQRSQRSTIVVEIPRASPHPSPMRPAPTRSAFSPSMSTAREPSASPSKRARTGSYLAPSVPPDSRAKLRAVSPSGSHSPTKRTATSDSSRPSKRQVRNMYTESEEAEMAVYVSRRLPRITEASLVDWKPFTDEHTARTPEAWVEHYRHYRCRIEALVQKLGGKIPGKRRPGQKRSRDDSDSEVEYIDDEPRARNTRPGGTKGQEIIIIDSDDD